MPKEYTVSKPFTDNEPPTFIEGYPLFEATDSGVSIDVMASRDGCKYFCIVTKVGGIPTKVVNIANNIDKNNWGLLPKNGSELPGGETATGNATSPTTTSVTNGSTYVGPSYFIRNGDCGRRVTNISITSGDAEGGLEANTQYIAYFVLQGDSPRSASKVYAFQFKTDVVTRPVLTVTLSSPKGTVQSNREADVWYALVTAGTTQAPFNLTLGDCATPGTNGWVANSPYASTPVLEAMRLDAPAGKTGSLFDAYADLNNSNTMSIINVVKSSGTSGGSIPVAVGPVALNKANNLKTTQDFSEYLVNNAEYWLVAVGQCQGTSGHAFRSNRYLKNTDSTPPQVSSLDTAITAGTIYYDDDYDLALTQPYSGTFRISFTEFLYYRISSESRKQIVDVFPVTNDGYMSSAALLSAGTTKFSINHTLSSVTDWTNPPGCDQLEISFTNIRPGEGITFSANLCDVNNNPGTPALALTLKLVEKKVGTRVMYQPVFDFSNSAVAQVWGPNVSPSV